MTSRLSSSTIRLLGVLFCISAGLLFFNVSFAADTKATKNFENTIPLRFDVVGDGVDLLPLELAYDASEQKKLLMAGVELSAATMSLRLLELRQLDSKLAKVLSPETAQENFLLFTWPELLLPEGNIEVISRSGRVIWRDEVTRKAKAAWRGQTEFWKSLISSRGANRELIEKSPFLKISYGRKFDPKSTASPFRLGAEPFRFCVSQSYDLGFARLCSQMFEVQKIGKVLQIVLFPVSEAPARVIAFNEIAKLADNVAVTKDKPVQFYAELSSGVSYEFVSQPTSLNLVEMTAEPGKEVAHLLAWGPRPSQAYKDLNKPETGLVELIGFQQTIGDLREFWETDLSLKEPVLYFPGLTGGMFKQSFNITRLPSESLRPYIATRTIEGTYVNGPKVFGRLAKGSSVSTTQNSVDNDKGSRDFTWYFRAERRGEFNKSYLQVNTGEQSFKTYYEIFKGYPRELSGRLSGIVSSEAKLVLMGELAFNYWFEDIWGWTNYYLARQRWGLSAKYFQSLTPFALGSRSEIFKVTTVDLKYRLTPGLWNRDETWGLIGGFQKVDYSTFNSSMLGVGGFWARSMPRVFDELMNLVPFMGYPKWVDAEFIMFLAPGDANTKINFPNYALNFHGKVMWTKSFFGEAGFGLKQYSFEDRTTRLKLQFGSLYGTAGLGLSF